MIDSWRSGWRSSHGRSTLPNTVAELECSAPRKPVISLCEEFQRRWEENCGCSSQVCTCVCRSRCTYVYFIIVCVLQVLYMTWPLTPGTMGGCWRSVWAAALSRVMRSSEICIALSPSTQHSRATQESRPCAESWLPMLTETLKSVTARYKHSYANQDLGRIWNIFVIVTLFVCKLHVLKICRVKPTRKWCGDWQKEHQLHFIL